MQQYKRGIKLLLTITILAVLLTLSDHGSALEEPAVLGFAEQENCSIVIDTNGSGHVQVEQFGRETRDVGAATISAGCQETVTLTAEPEGPWKFDGWLGADGPEKIRETIVISAPANVIAVFSPREITYIPADEPYYNRSGELVDTIPVYESVWQPLDRSMTRQSPLVAPEIEIWYGGSQPYGQPGISQEYFDILGTVSDENKDLSSLEYVLNGATETVALHYGGDKSKADGRRLWNQGDFIVNLHVDDLQEGTNQVSITATDSANNSVTEIVEVVYSPTPSGWPLPSNVKWGSAGDLPEKLLEVSQIVDGKWEIVDGGVRTTETGYDRLLNIGDVGWSSYEALVPVTIHEYSPLGFAPDQRAPALGLVLHWQGHTDNPKACEQPKCGWLYPGMSNWYEWEWNPVNGKAGFHMWVHHNSMEPDPGGFMLESETTYLWKIQVDNAAGPYGTYRLWVWPQGQPEPVDPVVEMEKPGNANSLQEGSLLLLAHHVDVTFGDVKLRELNGDFDDPQHTDFTADPAEMEATISWKTDEPTTAKIEYFDVPGNEKSVSIDTPTTDHVVKLLNLTPSTDYTVRITSEDQSLNRSTTEETFQTKEQLFTLEVPVAPGGVVQVDEVKPGYKAGELVTLTALQDDQHRFYRWIVEIEGSTPQQFSDNPLTITVSHNTKVSAVFRERAGKSFLPLAVGSR